MQEIFSLGRSIIRFTQKDLKVVVIGAVAGALIGGLVAQVVPGWSFDGGARAGIVAGAFFGLMIRSVTGLPFGLDRDGRSGSDGRES